MRRDSLDRVLQLLSDGLPKPSRKAFRHAFLDFDTPTTLIRRRGALTVAVLVTWTLLIALGALVLDVAMVSYQHLQLQAACDAAALAGAAELMSRDPTFVDPWLRSSGDETVAADDLRAHTFAARQAARYFATQNHVGGEPVTLDENAGNAADGDIVIGWVDDPTSARAFGPWNGVGPCNSVRVHVSRTRARGNPITLWIGRQLGITGIDMAVSSQATVDTRVYGFRPAGHVRVPLVPILVSAEDGADGWSAQASSRPVAGVNDRYAVNGRTGEIQFGADGVSEVVLEIQAADEFTSAGNASLVSISGAQSEVANLPECTEFGYSYQDLEYLGGEFALGENGELRLAGTPVAESGVLTACQSSLLVIRGQKRIWSLGSWNTKAGQIVVSFAAGRVLECYNSGEAGLQIVVQPCTLQTCTALVHSSAPPNPWLGKLVLTQ